MKNFKGIFTALLTPFDGDGKLNEQALGQLIENNIAAGVSGFYVTGSTAEVFLLTPEERRRVMQVTRECAGDRVTLICHVGAVSTDESVSLAREAQRLGYDAVSAVAPFYYKFSFDEIKAHYFKIACSVDLPMIVYNFPGFTGVHLTVDQIGEFLSDDRFLGVKHTSADYFALRQFKTAFPDKIIYNGYDETFLAGLSMGADGAIGSTFNFMADKFVRLRRLFLDGELKEAMALQEEIDVIIAALCKCGVMQGEKSILKARGIDFGQARAPFAPLSEDVERRLLDTVLPLL